MLAPFSEVREILTAFHEELTRIKDDEPDEIRGAFDKWLADADPERCLDVYQAARAYAKEILSDAGDRPAPATAPSSHEPESSLPRAHGKTTSEQGGVSA
jgi:hypothetical protein